MDRFIGFIILMVIAYLAISIGGIWAIVSFALYLFKDHPFDWTPVWIVITGVVFYLLQFIRILFQIRQ